MVGHGYTRLNDNETALNTGLPSVDPTHDNTTETAEPFPADEDFSQVWARNEVNVTSDSENNTWNEESGPSTSLLANHSANENSATHQDHSDIRYTNTEPHIQAEFSENGLRSQDVQPTSLWNSWFPRNVSREHITNSVRDGVFGNLIAKDDNQPRANGPPPAIDEDRPTPIDDNDDLTPAGQPPTYEEASADATPSYWESTLLAAGYGDEILVRDMPVGSVIIFILNLLLCVALGFFGFFLGYIFHTTHAGKYGSLTGLGVLIISSALEMKSTEVPRNGPEPEQTAPYDPNSFQDAPALGYVMQPTGRVASETVDSSSEYVSKDYFLLAVGIALIIYALLQYIRALCEYYRIKRRQAEEDGAVYQSPHQSLRQAWDNIFHYARASASGRPQAQGSDENTGTASELHTPPRPGSPSPPEQNSRVALETV